MMINETQTLVIVPGAKAVVINAVEGAEEQKNDGSAGDGKDGKCTGHAGSVKGDIRTVT